MKVVLIGSGNLATHLAMALRDARHCVMQIYSFTQENAQKLADCVGAQATHRIDEIRDDADFYIFSIKDDALNNTLNQMPHKKGIWVHTAGSVPMDIFEPYMKKYGVLYPLQTFSKNRPVDFSIIPVCIEGSTVSVSEQIELLARSISKKTGYLPSEKRKYLHLAAVFACNFTNHLYTLAAEIIAKEGISFDMLKPLISETAAKVQDMNPQKTQTGPAVRFDESIMQNQQNLIEDKQTKDIYSLLSKSIYTHSI